MSVGKRWILVVAAAGMIAGGLSSPALGMRFDPELAESNSAVAPASTPAKPPAFTESNASAFTATNASTFQAGLDAIVAAGSDGTVAEITDSYRGTWQGASGVSDRATGAKATADAHFRVGSLTKTLTATAVLQLVGDRKLALTDTVAKHLGSPVVNSDTITVKQLLNHTAGTAEIQDYLPSYSSSWQRSFTEDELLGYVKSAPARSAPGEKYQYSNTNYLLLALIVEKVTGSPYDQAIRNRILTPLGMTQTSIPYTGGVPTPSLHGYAVWNDVATDVTNENPSRRIGFGQAVSTAHDMNLFYSGLLSGKLLKSAELSAMKTTVRPTATNPNFLAGLGIFRQTTYCGATVWGHTGQVGGYEAISYHTENGQRHVTFGSTATTSAPAAARWKFVETAFCTVPLAATGNSSAGPAAYTRGYPLNQIFTRTKAGTVVQIRRYDGAWYRWNPTGAPIKGQPAIVSGGSDDTRIFYRGSNDHLWQILISGGKTTFSDTGIAIAGSPTGYSTTPANYQIFAKAPSGNDLLRIYPSGTTWKAQNLAGEIGSDLAANSTGPGYGEVYYRKTNGKLGQAYLSSGTWRHREAPVSVALSSAVSAVAWGDGHTEIYGRGTNAHLWQVTVHNGVWSAKDLGTATTVATAPALYSTGPGQVCLFGRTGSQTILSTCRSGSTWTTKSLGGNIIGTLAAYSSGPSDGSVLAVYKDGTKLMRVYRSGSTWVWETAGAL